MFLNEFTTKRFLKLLQKFSEAPRKDGKLILNKISTF